MALKWSFERNNLVSDNIWKKKNKKINIYITKPFLSLMLQINEVAGKKHIGLKQ